MRMLICSSDLEDLEQVIKRLVCACIPCAVCKEPLDSHVSVWIQQDLDFPLALRVVMNRETPRRLPHWARVYDLAVPATNGKEPLNMLVVESSGPTQTGTGATTAPTGRAPATPPPIPRFRLSPPLKR
jgi:hypothetical protein